MRGGEKPDKTKPHPRRCIPLTKDHWLSCTIRDSSYPLQIQVQCPDCLVAIQLMNQIVPVWQSRLLGLQLEMTLVSATPSLGCLKVRQSCDSDPHRTYSERRSLPAFLSFPHTTTEIPWTGSDLRSTMVRVCTRSCNIVCRQSAVLRVKRGLKRLGYTTGHLFI